MGLRAQLAKFFRDNYMVGHVNYDNPSAIAVNGIVTAVNLTNTALTVAGHPDVPRALKVVIVDTTPGITAGIVTIVGVDVLGRTMTEVFDCAAGAGTYSGNIPFATVTSVTTSNFTALGGGGDETISVGVLDKLGLPCRKLRGVHKACVDGANEAVGTVSTTYGTIIPTTATNGTRDYDFWYTYYHTPETY